MNWIDYQPKHSYVKENNPYGDYINHCISYKQMMGGGKITSAHECTHGTNSEIRNSAITDFFKLKDISIDFLPKQCSLIQPLNPQLITGEQINGFYVGQNRAITIKEPHIRKKQAASFIPKSMREHRFSLYVSGQSAWDNQPLYIFDEWTAYQAGADVAIWMFQNGDNSEKGSDWILGVVEFIIYSLGVLLCTEKNDPEAFNRDSNLLEFSKFNLKRSFDQYHIGREMYPWDSQDNIFNILKNENDGKEMRRFMKEKMNLDVPDSIHNEDELDLRDFDLYG